MNKQSLSRELGIVLLLLYGLGNILGAGIYVLIGKISAIAGYFSVISFVIASIIAFFTALSYMELASRYPVSAGEAVYIQEGIGSKALSIGTGIFIAFSGLISASVLVRGFLGYLAEFITLDSNYVIIFIVILLSAVCIRGIKFSVISASIFTLIEIFGLLMIIYIGFDNITNPIVDYDKFIPKLTFSNLGIIFLGSFLAFYAFIGFEDMINVAQEVKNPAKSFPIAIFLALSISTIIYILITIVALQTLSLQELLTSTAPLSNIYQKITSQDPFIISAIGLFAVINGVLIQIIMASRVIYGLSSRGWFFKYFSSISETTKTPIKATILVGILIILFALFFDITTLANFTSTLLLIIFTLVNISLVAIKYNKKEVKNIINIPIIIPIIGVFLNISLLGSKWLF